MAVSKLRIDSVEATGDGTGQVAVTVTALQEVSDGAEVTTFIEIPGKAQIRVLLDSSDVDTIVGQPPAQVKAAFLAALAAREPDLNLAALNSFADGNEDSVERRDALAGLVQQLPYTITL